MKLREIPIDPSLVDRTWPMLADEHEIEPSIFDAEDEFDFDAIYVGDVDADDYPEYECSNDAY